MAPTVEALFIYPVKSCRGISVRNAVVCPTGFAWDRQWMVVSDRGRFLTQRQEPRLALVEPSLPMEALAPGWEPLGPQAAMVLRAPGMEPLHIPLCVPREERLFADVAVWEWAGQALDEGPDAADWFSEFLGKKCRLVRFDSEHALRPTDEAYADGFQTAFSDGYPFLMISQPSLDTLNAKLTEALPINRFRPKEYCGLRVMGPLKQGSGLIDGPYKEAEGYSLIEKAAAYEEFEVLAP